MDAVIREALERTLKELGIWSVDFVVEHPSDISHGDYASNVALVSFKGRREFEKATAGDSDTIDVQYGVELTNPRQLAEAIAVKLEGQIEYVEKITIAGPGFINFHLTRDFFTHELRRATEAGDTWGANDREVGEHILFEYTSPNLFKPLHIGNLVGNIVGESLSRLLEFSGGSVHRVNYPSDIGLTVAKGVWGLQKTGGDPDDITALGEAYRMGNEAYESDAEAKAEIEAVNRALYKGDDEALTELRQRGIATSKRHLDALCKKLGTQFDAEIFESEAGPEGEEIVEAHITDGTFEESDGAVVYKGERDGLHTRVFLNSQGLPTYEAKDLGNFTKKQVAYPDWTQSFVVTGNEQTEYFKVLYAAIRRIYPETNEKKLVHIPTGFLTLSTGKMSSRKGNVLTGESLIEEMENRARERASESRAENTMTLGSQIAVAALKYQILRQRLGSDITFDRERALSFEGDSGPYLQYTYARIGSVLAKAHDEGVVASATHAPDVPYILERLLYRFEEEVEIAGEECEPHHLVTYLTELAGAFNTFYVQEKIADISDEYAPYKAVVAAATAQTLKNGLYLLGIEAPERM